MRKSDGSFRARGLSSLQSKYLKPTILIVFVLQGLLILKMRMSHSLPLNSLALSKGTATKASTRVMEDALSIPKENVESIESFDAGAFVESLEWDAPIFSESSEAASQCHPWLLEKDNISYNRDFRVDPIVVSGSDEKMWKDCSVGCHHTSVSTSDIDASFSNVGPGSISIIRSMEPRAYYPLNDVNAALDRGFQVVMTVHLNSHVPVGYFSWEEYEIMKPISEKDMSKGLAVAFISNCNANNFRAEAVVKLQDWIKVDSYGSCANNMPHEMDKLAVIQQYKFCLAFENSCEDDYLTEKFWQSLVAGCVPVVIGPPNAQSFAPANDSIIRYTSLKETEAVARKIMAVHENETEWWRMMAWKRDGPSDQFKALVDMSAVHSSCRLCIHLADKWVAEEERKGGQKRPCRCLSLDGSVDFHVFVRERGMFYYESVFLKSTELTLKGLTSAVLHKFASLQYVPVWRSKRPPVLVHENDPLKVYHIYPFNNTQREALYGDAWFRDSQQFREHLKSHPCPKLEVIFV